MTIKRDRTVRNERYRERNRLLKNKLVEPTEKELIAKKKNRERAARNREKAKEIKELIGDETSKPLFGADNESVVQSDCLLECGCWCKCWLTAMSVVMVFAWMLVIV